MWTSFEILRWKRGKRSTLMPCRATARLEAKPKKLSTSKQVVDGTGSVCEHSRHTSAASWARFAFEQLSIPSKIAYQLSGNEASRWARVIGACLERVTSMFASWSRATYAARARCGLSCPWMLVGCWRFASWWAIGRHPLNRNRCWPSSYAISICESLFSRWSWATKRASAFESLASPG